MDLTTILNWIKPSPKYFFALALSSGILLIMPDKVIRYFDLYIILTIYRPWISLIFFVSSALVCAEFGYHILIFLNGIYRKIESFWIASRALHNLSSDEKEFLAKFIKYDTKSINLPLSSGLATSLKKSQLIYQGSIYGNAIDGISYNICPSIWKKLKKDPMILEPEINEVNNDDDY